MRKAEKVDTIRKSINGSSLEDVSVWKFEDDGSIVEGVEECYANGKTVLLKGGDKSDKRKIMAKFVYGTYNEENRFIEFCTDTGRICGPHCQFAGKGNCRYNRKIQEKAGYYLLEE